jgi:RNA polymerase-binding transcription factor DksA
MTTTAARKAQLEDRLAHLTARLNTIGTELDTHNSRDWEELATEREHDEALEAMGKSGKQEIRMIKAALKRIDEDEYGYCVTCGNKIADARLDLLPYTPFCSNCAP